MNWITIYSVGDLRLLNLLLKGFFGGGGGGSMFTHVIFCSKCFGGDAGVGINRRT
jgi:hypothetical protein